MSRWHNVSDVRRILMDNGWKSPNCYSNEFESPGAFPAIYLFQLFETETYTKGLVAYVGQSISLKSRWSGHEILRQLDRPGYWVKRWFKRTPADTLDELELRYIQEFDPPWNIQGRPRGVALP